MSAMCGRKPPSHWNLSISSKEVKNIFDCFGMFVNKRRKSNKHVRFIVVKARGLQSTDINGLWDAHKLLNYGEVEKE